MTETIEATSQKALTPSQRPGDDKQPKILAIAKGGGIVLLGETLGRVFVYFYNFFLARAIGAGGLGLVTLGLTVVSMASSLATLGLSQGVVRFGAIYATGDEKAKLRDILVRSFGISLTAGIVVVLVLLALAPWLSESVFDAPFLTPLLILLSLTIPFTIAKGVFLAATRAFKIAWMYVLVERVFLQICILVLTFALVALNLGLRGVGLAYTVSSALAAFLAYYLLSQLLPAAHKRREPSVSTASLLKFSLPLSLVSLVQFTYERTETIFLGLMSNVANVGIYNVALRTANFETMFVYALSVIFSPFVSDLYERKALSELESLYKTTAQWSFTIGLAMFLIFVMFSEPILGLFGSEFVEGTPVLLILGVAQLVNAGMGQAGYVLVMTGHSGLALANTIVLLVSSVILDVALIPRYGLLGAAIAGSLAMLIFSVLRAAQVYHILKMHPLKRAFWKPVVAGLVALLATSALRLVFLAEQDTLALFVLSPVFLLLFVLLIYKLGLESDDKMVLLAIRRKMNEYLPSPREA
jgi:O-antigen/teichoic acid export membrane protein